MSLIDLNSSPSVISAVLYGAMAIGEANSFAPNYAKAKMSASHLMMLMNLEPAIDNLSQEGEKPVRERIYFLTRPMRPLLFNTHAEHVSYLLRSPGQV